MPTTALVLPSPRGSPASLVAGRAGRVALTVSPRPTLSYVPRPAASRAPRPAHPVPSSPTRPALFHASVPSARLPTPLLPPVRVEAARLPPSTPRPCVPSSIPSSFVLEQRRPSAAPVARFLCSAEVCLSTIHVPIQARQRIQMLFVLCVVTSVVDMIMINLDTLEAQSSWQVLPVNMVPSAK